MDRRVVGVIGSRGFTDREYVWAELDRARALWGDFTVVSGGAKGPDTFAHQWANMRHLPMIIFRPDYGTHRAQAPLMRNHQIVNASTCLLAFWDGRSRGTAYTIRIAQAAGKKVYVRSPRPTDNLPQEENHEDTD